MLKQSMMTLATLAILVSLSGVSRADETGNEAVEGYRQLTCAEAQQKAWFVRELERSDGDTPHDVATPRECSRELIASAESAEESK
jgi:H2-forming N5,N10-methylenetetrahydromethanopterin dehydrogenase-like enzyme